MSAKIHTKSYSNNDRLFFLLNPSDDIAENDPVRIVDAIVEHLDLKDFKKLYRERGRCAYHPKMMLKIILYAYMNNIYSCRKIERQVQRDIHYIWRAIAHRYKDETTILGYELINEPIPHYWENKDSLNALVEPLHKRCVKAIREVDTNHIILLGGTQWNSNFAPFADTSYDDKLMYTCHRYGGGASKEAISHFIEFRDSVDLPMYMGEIGHNTDEWQAEFCKVMREANIGYTFWPYKKVDNSCFNAITRPENWDKIVEFAKADRSTYEKIRMARPDQAIARKALLDFIENAKCARCTPQRGYIESLGLTLK